MKKLKISVLQYQKQSPSYHQSNIFDLEGGTIGRGDENTWVLMDSNKFLSRVQASIIVRGNDYYITDESTNGCYINGLKEPLGRGNTHKIAEEDIILMGEYELLASYVEDSYEVEAVNLSHDNQSWEDASDPFSDVFNPKGNDYVRPEVDFPISINSPVNFPKLTSAEEESIVTSKEKSGYTQIFGGKDDDLPEDSLSIKEVENFPLDNLQENTNTLLRVKNKKEAEKSVSVNQKEIVSKDSIFERPQNKQLPNSSDRTGVSSFSKSEGNFRGIFGEECEIQPVTSTNPSDAAKTNIEVGNNFDEPDNKHIFTDVASDQPQANINENSSSLNKERVRTASFNDGKDVKEAKTAKKEKEEEAQIYFSLIECLFKGMGQKPVNKGNKISENVAISIGEILYESLQGMIELLKSRTDLKNQLRLDRTIIGSIQNNPLKYMINAEQVIKHILQEEDDKTYMPLIDAIKESFDDIKAHQYAVSISMQRALMATAKLYFSPESMQKKLDSVSPLGSKIPVQREAKLWSMFKETYAGMEDEATEIFQAILEKEIAKEYELQIMAIKHQRLK